MTNGQIAGLDLATAIGRSSFPITTPGTSPSRSSSSTRAKLDENRTFPDKDRRGAPREGAGLLQGIVRCGRCGRRMSVRYRERSNLVYACAQLHHRFGLPYCQSFRGDRVDAEGLTVGQPKTVVKLSEHA